MKKAIAICLLAAALFLLGGCTLQQAQLNPIGVEAARKLALEDAGLQSREVRFEATTLAHHGDMDYYPIRFTTDSGSYRYDIEALTGTVIERSAPNGEQPAPPEKSPAPSDGITQEQAKALALEHAGYTEDEVTFVKCGLDWDNGVKTYDVEFYTKEFLEFDYEIDPETGAVLDWDKDAEYYSPPEPKPEAPSTISADQAKAIAIAQVPGASLSDIREFETDYDDGRLEYEGKIYYGGMEYEFEIDGYSGAIRSWEVESIYDDDDD